MTYLHIVRMAQSPMLTQRCVACAAQELPLGVEPQSWVALHTWLLSAQPGWAEAWEAADTAAGVQADWGADESVVTDGQILSATQTLIAEEGVYG